MPLPFALPPSLSPHQIQQHGTRKHEQGQQHSASAFAQFQNPGSEHLLHTSHASFLLLQNSVKRGKGGRMNRSWASPLGSKATWKQGLQPDPTVTKQWARSSQCAWSSGSSWAQKGHCLCSARSKGSATIPLHPTLDQPLATNLQFTREARMTTNCSSFTDK